MKKILAVSCVPVLMLAGSFLFTSASFAQSQQEQCPPEECEPENPGGGGGKKSTVEKITVDIEEIGCEESLQGTVTTRNPDEATLLVTFSGGTTYTFSPVIQSDGSFVVDIDYSLPNIRPGTYSLEIIATHTPTQTLARVVQQIDISMCRRLLETGGGEPERKPATTRLPEPFSFGPEQEEEIVLPIELPKTGASY